MTSIAETSRLLTENFENLVASEALLRKSVKVVPAGRPRTSNKNVDHVTSDDDFDITAMLAELRSELDAKRSEEDKLQKEISDILSNSATVGNEQSRAFGMAVSRLNNSMMLVESDAKQLAASLSTISRLADTISGRVSSLDVAKTRVVECLQLADDLRDLGVCSEGVDEAIRNEDFEQAAQHIHRFLTLDKAVFQVKDQADKDVGQSVIHSYEVLTNAKGRLKEILERRLDDAIERNKVPSMQRFVKLFPLISEHDSGLGRFAGYLGSLISKLGEDRVKIMNAGGTDDTRLNVLYADTLFLFFEGIANLLDSNQPVIANSYGADKLLDFFNMLQKSIDDVVEKILDAFSKKRQMSKYAKTAKKLLFDAGKTKTLERLDPMELDVLLSELCLMNTHSEMYWRFIKRRLGDPHLDDDEFVMVGEVREELDEEAKKKKQAESQKRKELREKKVDQLVNRSAVGTKMQELLGQYLLLEQYYMEESIKKAIDMDIREEGLMSSVVDDVLFLVKKCVRRAMTSGSVDCVCAALNNGCSLLETLFLEHMDGFIKNGYPSVGFAAEAFQTAQTAYNVLQHGKTVTEAGPDAQRDAFLTAGNNARGSAELIRQLGSSLQAEWLKNKRSPVETAKLDHSLSQLEEVAKRMAALANHAVEALVVAAFRPKIKSSCEAYVDLPHCLSDTQLSEFEAVDPFIESFNANIDKQLAFFEPLLHKDNFQALLLVVCGEVARQLERVIAKCSFNLLGAVQLDKEFRHLASYLSGVAGWSSREKTNRLSQIVTLLNVATAEEATDLWEAGRGNAVVRALSGTEAKKFLLLRIDLPANIIQNLDF